MKTKVMLLALAAAVSACSWVDTQPGAERVAVIDKYQAESCQRIGTAKAQTLNKLLLVARDEQKIHKELLTLARNQASKIGGNALLPLAPAADGKQEFAVYNCKP